MRTDVERAMDQYGNMLFKTCLLMLCSEADAQDAVQETFCRYWQSNRKFENEEHEKAWLIRVAINQCRDIRRFEKRHPSVDITELSDCYETKEQCETLQKILELLEKLKLVLNLYYVEGYHVEEIAGILRISESAVKKRLQRGRLLLKESLIKENEQ